VEVDTDEVVAELVFNSRMSARVVA